MSIQEVPHLTEAQVRNLATPQSFDRGKTYYRNRAIVNPTRQGMKLWADCRGSELYQTTAMLGGEDGITNATCTCPYDWGGLCKHQVALLLTYVHQPEAFEAIPPLAEMLASRSQEDLIALIEHMVQRHPDLLTLVERSAAPSLGTPIDLSTYRRQAKRALRRSEMEEIAEDLEMLCDTANELLQAGDWLNAGSLFQMLLEETTAAYNDELRDIDYDGAVGGLSQDFAEGLGQCLENGQDFNQQIREKWLQTLLAAVLKDLELGGIDFGAGAADALLEWATEEEWEWIEQRIRQEIQRSDRWKQDTLVNLLAARRRETGQEEEANLLIHELGSPEQRAFLLVQEERFEEAMAIAHQHFTTLPGLVIQFADALLRANKPELALEYITQQNAQNSRGYAEWLIKFYQEHQNPELALHWQQQAFQQSPSISGFRELRKLAQQTGLWDNLRAEILKQLEQDKRFAILIDIALDEGDGDRALDLLNRSTDWSRFSYRLRVAEAIEKSQPKAALDIYQPLVDKAIAERNRNSYRTAAEYLKKIKSLYQSLKAQNKWQTYIQKIRTTYSNLPALQDEMNKAGL